MIAAEIVECMADAAFASRPHGGIIAWNRAARQLLGYRESDVLGHPCHRVLAGRDVFGNQFCSASCAVVRMALKREAISRFEIHFRHKSGKIVPVGATIVVIPNGAPSKVDLIHALASRRLEPSKDRCGSELGPSLCDPDNLGHVSPACRCEATVRLTRREIEVIGLMAEGSGTREIAGQLNISVATARNHIQNILSRLEVHTRLEAVSVARRYRLI